MTQSISNMAEEIYPISDTDTIEYKVRMIEKRKGWVSGYTAALTSPASGWVKVLSEKDLPEGEQWYEVHYGRKKPDREELTTIKAKHYFSLGYTLYYLSETPLPTVEECMEYAKEKQSAQYDTGGFKYFTFKYNQFLELIKYSQTYKKNQHGI